MICIALTGIAGHVLRDLLSRRIRTVEIRSPSNFFALLNLQPGDSLFLTEHSPLDIVPGTDGLIASAEATQIITHRLIHSAEDFYEEREAQAARVQLRLVGVGKVRRISSSYQMGSPLMLEVDQIKFCDAR
jgi:hypothetical protein